MLVVWEKYHSENLKATDYWEDQGVDGVIILKLMSRN
jgi:hypothetical protein